MADDGGFDSGPKNDAAGPFSPGLNHALSESFGGSSLAGLSVSWGVDEANAALGAHATTRGSNIALSSSIRDDVHDPHSMKIIGHEVAHALAGGGSGDTFLDQEGDPGEAAAHAAGDAFGHYAEHAMAGPAPKLAPAHGGQASIHRFLIEGSVFKVNDPMHETLTQESLKAAGVLPPDGKYTDPAAWNYTRGAMWNDDPQNLLFDDSKEGRTNNPSLGVDWVRQFKSAEGDVKDGTKFGVGDSLMQRNQGDLSAFHAMASEDNEDPEFTKQKLMMWAEFTTRVAQGGIAGDAKIGELELDNPMFKQLLGEDPTQMNKDVNGFFGIQGKDANLQQRATGSLLHMIQDSYAGGHTEREDLGGGRLGAITNFHSYDQQDHSKHNDADSLPEGDGTIEEKVHRMRGGQDAIDQGGAVIRMIRAGIPPEKVLEYLDQNTFKVADDIGPASAGEHFEHDH